MIYLNPWVLTEVTETASYFVINHSLQQINVTGNSFE